MRGAARRFARNDIETHLLGGSDRRNREISPPDLWSGETGFSSSPTRGEMVDTEQIISNEFLTSPARFPHPPRSHSDGEATLAVRDADIYLVESPLRSIDNIAEDRRAPSRNRILSEPQEISAPFRSRRGVRFRQLSHLV